MLLQRGYAARLALGGWHRQAQEPA